MEILPMWLLLLRSFPIGTRLGMILDTQRDQAEGLGSVFAEPLIKALVDGRHRQLFETFEWKVSTQGHTSKFVIVYRPPYSAMHLAPAGVFFQEFLARFWRVLFFAHRCLSLLKTLTSIWTIHLMLTPGSFQTFLRRLNFSST